MNNLLKFEYLVRESKRLTKEIAIFADDLDQILRSDIETADANKQILKMIRDNFFNISNAAQDIYIDASIVSGSIAE